MFSVTSIEAEQQQSSGEIPPELDALDSLKLLALGNNLISGEIPLTLAGCKSLEIVDLSFNNLSGSLNDAVAKWSKLKFLSLSHNNFNGALPSWLFSFEAIQTMDLSGNKFSGNIPDGNFNISSNFNHGFSGGADLGQPSISVTDPDVQVSVTIADKTELIFNYNLSTIVGIDISDNSLQGEIPAGLFALQGLQYLNLSYNFLDGQIPVGLGKMWSLKVLDLSHNSFSGPIQENISSLGNLTILNLSYNCLSGIIPTRQGYWKFPGAFAGNPNLCLESSNDGCKGQGLPAVPGHSFTYENENGVISIWIFCVSAFVSFYAGVVALCCSAQTRNYILQTKRTS
ncbi:UNVERIFIED_CONTAM: Receptor-like protein CLAVATA2 [Sesamum calycinum]|uniref:Receptor-like protein CLAVATA2 n=1 Tax=Sesamum calycinum TaxID=2727403 RepID=A0AAW2RRK2_9LAMI